VLPRSEVERLSDRTSPLRSAAAASLKQVEAKADQRRKAGKSRKVRADDKASAR
jgi:hypothetical protein